MSGDPDPGRRLAQSRTDGQLPPVSILMRIALALFLGVALAGCSVDGLLWDSPPLPADEPAPADEPSTAIVTIRFRNLAVDEAVNVEFYATNNPVATLPDDLFVDQNLVLENVGVAGTGILEPLREDTLEFPCTNDLAIGTLGGTFLDNETGEWRGRGVSRWAQEAALELCGRRVLIEYVGEFGTFTTRIAVGN